MKLLRSILPPLAGLLALAGVVALAALAAGVASNGWAAIGLASALGAAWLGVRLTRSWVPRRTLLEIDFNRGIVEQVPTSPLARAEAAKAYPLLDIVEGLERASTDKRIVGLVARIGGDSPGIARAQEIAAAVAGFSAAGKPAIAFAETFGEVKSGSLETVLIGSSCDQLFLQPGGEMGMTGLVARKFYLRGLFDKLGITPQFDHRHEYKAAKYLLTEDHMVEPDREATGKYLTAQFEQLIDGIAAGRNLSPAIVRSLIDRAPLLATEAKEAGLVDDLLYRDQVYERIRSSWGAGARTLDAATYLKRARRPHRRGPTIALIYGTGAVVQGASRFDPLTRQPSMGSDDMAKAFRAAIDSKRVKAIVFRIDSPGGSAVASDSIWRETRRAVEAGKPVVATMGNLAASGGYFVAAGCSRIVAQPGTLTGSIGVVAGKLVTREAWARAGITFDDVARGENARFMGTDFEFTDSENQRFQALLDAIYEDFVTKVAEGRGKTFAEAEAVARGRVWAGSDGLELGLVDALGGIRTAVDLARQEAGLDPAKPYRLSVTPKPRSPLAALLSRDGRDDEKVLAGEILSATAALAEPAAELGAATGSGLLSVPGWRARL